MEIRNAISLVLIVASTVLITKLVNDKYNELNNISERVDSLTELLYIDIENDRMTRSDAKEYFADLELITESIKELKK